jgi:hypothetical protein
MRGLLLVGVLGVAGCSAKEEAAKPPEKQELPAYGTGGGTTIAVVKDEKKRIIGTAKELMDDTPKAKGKSFALALSMFEPGKSLRELVGGDVEMSGTTDGVHVRVTVSLPKDLTVPNASSVDTLYVGFDCTEGDLKRGNIAVRIVRP